MNKPRHCPGRRLPQGGGYLTPPPKPSLTAISSKGLWKLPDLTGLWTPFEEAFGGWSPHPLGNPPGSHRSLDALRSRPCGSRAHKLPQPPLPDPYNDEEENMRKEELEGFISGGVENALASAQLLPTLKIHLILQSHNRRFPQPHPRRQTPMLRQWTDRLKGETPCDNTRKLPLPRAAAKIVT